MTDRPAWTSFLCKWLRTQQREHAYGIVCLLPQADDTHPRAVSIDPCSSCSDWQAEETDELIKDRK